MPLHRRNRWLVQGQRSYHRHIVRHTVAGSAVPRTTNMRTSKSDTLLWDPGTHMFRSVSLARPY